MKKGAFISGAFLSGILSSVCCIGPLVFSWVGTGFAGLAISQRYRPVFITLSLMFLGISWVLTMKKRKIECGGGYCEIKGRSKTQIIIMSVLTVIVLFFILFPQFLALISG